MEHESPRQSCGCPVGVDHELSCPQKRILKTPGIVASTILGTILGTGMALQTEHQSQEPTHDVSSDVKRITITEPESVYHDKPAVYTNISTAVDEDYEQLSGPTFNLLDVNFSHNAILAAHKERAEQSVWLRNLSEEDRELAEDRYKELLRRVVIDRDAESMHFFIPGREDVDTTFVTNGPELEIYSKDGLEHIVNFASGVEEAYNPETGESIGTGNSPDVDSSSSKLAMRIDSLITHAAVNDVMPIEEAKDSGDTGETGVYDNDGEEGDEEHVADTGS